MTSEIITKRAKYIIYHTGKSKLKTLLNDVQFQRDIIMNEQCNIVLQDEVSGSTESENDLKNASVGENIRKRKSLDVIPESITSKKCLSEDNPSMIQLVSTNDFGSESKNIEGIPIPPWNVKNTSQLMKQLGKKLENLNFSLIPMSQVKDTFSRNTCDKTFILQKYEHTLNDLVPTCIFRISYSDDDMWYGKNDDLQLGFHGTNFVNSFSILVGGLSPNVKNEGRKELLYGKAIYLAKDIRVARDFSRISTFRNQSLVSVVFIVEYKSEQCAMESDYIMVQHASHCRVRGILWYEKSIENWHMKPIYVVLLLILLPVFYYIFKSNVLLSILI